MVSHTGTKRLSSYDPSAGLLFELVTDLGIVYKVLAFQACRLQELPVQGDFHPYFEEDLGGQAVVCFSVSSV